MPQRQLQAAARKNKMAAAFAARLQLIAAWTGKRRSSSAASADEGRNFLMQNIGIINEKGKGRRGRKEVY